MKQAKTGWLLMGVLCLALWATAASAQDMRCLMSVVAGAKALQEGRYAEAEKLLKIALQEVEKLGPNDECLALALGSLGELYRRQEKYAGHGR